jgi:hypothetical protein
LAVAERADCLVTPANIQIFKYSNIERWNRLEEENYRRCNQEYKPTLANILNRCTQNFRSMTDRQTDRHDRVVKCVRKAFEKHIAGDIQGGIQENTTIPIENLPDQFIIL